MTFDLTDSPVRTRALARLHSIYRIRESGLDSTEILAARNMV